MIVQGNEENQKKAAKELEKVAFDQLKCLFQNKLSSKKVEHNLKLIEDLDIKIEKYGVDAEFVRSCVRRILKYKILNILCLGLVKKFNHKKDKYRRRIAENLKDSYDVVIDNTDVDDLVFPIFEKSKVSIIIPCYNGFDITMKCLRSVLAYTRDIPYEVIIADDKSTDEIKNIEKHAKNVKHVVNTLDNGFVNNCNSGATVAKGEYLFFLNNDTQVQENYLKPLIDVLDSRDDITITGSMMLYPNGVVQEAGGVIFRDARAMRYGWGEKWSNSPELNQCRDTDYISGAALMIRKNAFDKLQGFDKIYNPGYCEDSDLCFRVKYQLHGRVFYEPRSKVVHFDSSTFQDDKKQQLILRNRKYFYDRFNNELGQYHTAIENFDIKARDARASQFQMLVIDMDILTPSYDTGSRNTLMYMRLFQKHGFNVKYMPFIKSFDKDKFLKDMEYQGFEIIRDDQEKYIQENGKLFDLVFINRPEPGKKFIPLIRQYTHAFVMFHGQDLHYLRLYRQDLVNKVPNAEEIMLKRKAEELSVYEKMDLSLFVSESEKSMVQKELPFSHMTDIPVFLCDTEVMDSFSYKPEERCDIAFIAGFGHTPNIDGVVYFVKEVLPIILQKLPNLKLYVIGSRPTQDVKDLASDNVIVTGFVTDEELTAYYRKIKLIVAPLRIGAGVKGKVIEAIYNKVPIVTTEIGAEGIDNSNNIITVVKSKEEFATSVIDLYSNDEKLSEISNKSKKFIEEHYTAEVGFKKICKYLPKKFGKL